MEQLVYNVKTRFSQCYKVFLELYGPEALIEVLSNCEVTSRHYKSLINYFNELRKTHPLADLSFYYKNDN